MQVYFEVGRSLLAEGPPDEFLEALLIEGLDPAGKDEAELLGVQVRAIQSSALLGPGEQRGGPPPFASCLPQAPEADRCAELVPPRTLAACDLQCAFEALLCLRDTCLGGALSAPGGRTGGAEGNLSRK